jgi:hypothetical protein
MQLVLNEIDAEEVRRETFQGRKFLVAPVVPIRAMNLDNGYVPKTHVAKSAPAWNGTPVTLNHPRDSDGRLVSANSPGVANKTWLGWLFNNQVINGGDATQGEIWIDEQNARGLDGEAEEIVDRLENGDPLTVSTSYFGDKLEPGTYDGKQRSDVMGNLRPDHLAILPNKEGKCSIEDGCVAGPQAANSNVPQLRVAVTDDPDESGEELTENVSFNGTASGKLDESKLDAEEHDLEDHYLYGSGDSKSDFSYPVVDGDGKLRKCNVESAHQL